MAKLLFAKVDICNTGSAVFKFKLYRCSECLAEYAFRASEKPDLERCEECGEEFEKDGDDNE